MGDYINSVEATTNATLDTEDTLIEIDQTANTSGKIKRVTVTYANASLAMADNNYEVRLVSKTVAGTGGISGTINKVRNTSVASDYTATVKNGTTAFTVGTIDKTYKTWGFNEKIGLDHIFAVPIEIPAGDIVGVLVKCGVASRVIRAEIEWEE